jgi:DNA-binding beta-propeller fold protein YncE
MRNLSRVASTLLALVPAAAMAEAPQYSSQTIKLPAQIRSTAIAAGADRAVAVSSDKNLTVWDLANSRLLRTIALETAEVDCTALSPDGLWIFTAFHSGHAAVWDARSGKSVLQLQLPHYASTASFSPDGKLLAIAPGGDPAQVFEVASFRKLSQTLSVTGGVQAMAFSRDGALLATADSDTEVRVYEARTGKLIAENRDFLLEPLALDFTADGKQVIAAGGDRIIAFIDAKSGKLIRQLPKTDHPVFFSGLKVSPDGSLVALVFMKAENMTQPAPVVTWNLSSRQKKSEWLPPTLAFGMDWTNDSRQVAFGSESDSLTIWRGH